MTAKKPDRLAVLRDAFVMDLLRQAREFGQQEERQRVTDWLLTFGTLEMNAVSLAILAGTHDGGRPFKPLAWTWPDEDEDSQPAGDAAAVPQQPTEKGNHHG